MYKEGLNIWRLSFEASSDQILLEALVWLEKAVEAREQNIPYLNIDPIFDYMRDDQRFKNLIARVGL